MNVMVPPQSTGQNAALAGEKLRDQMKTRSFHVIAEFLDSDRLIAYLLNCNLLPTPLYSLSVHRSLKFLFLI